MSLIKKLFGSQGEKFYLELEETATDVVEEAKKQIDKVTDSQPVKQAVETGKEVTAEVKQQVDKATDSQPVKQAVETGKEVAAAAKSTTSKPQPSAQQKSQQTESGASSWEQPFWVKVMYNNSNNGSNGKADDANGTFATDYLMPTVSKSRRRPGPSLNKFKDMASKAKTPKG